MNIWGKTQHRNGYIIGVLNNSEAHSIEQFIHLPVYVPLQRAVKYCYTKINKDSFSAFTLSAHFMHTRLIH